ncbi:hypothetical protein HK405_010742, partial [Cladochytrium tenue]
MVVALIQIILAAIVVWILNIVAFELLLPRLYLSSCDWPVPSAPGTTSHVAILADPQLTDAFSYRQKPGLILTLTQFYSDVFMRRNFKLLLRTLRPAHVVIVGDLFDGGREWVGDLSFRFDQELRRWRRIFAAPPDVQIKVIAGNHDVGFQT